MSAKPSSGEPCSTCKRSTDENMCTPEYQWDGYLRITFSNSDAIEIIPLGKLAPPNKAKNCNYMDFQHWVLLRELVRLHLIPNQDTNFKLLFKYHGENFNLASKDGYLCALGAFSLQARATPDRFMPMHVVFQLEPTLRQTKLPSVLKSEGI